MDGGGQIGCFLGNVLGSDLYRGQNNLAGQILGNLNSSLDKREEVLRGDDRLPVVLLRDVSPGPAPGTEGRGEYELVDVSQSLIISQLAHQH